MHQGAKPNKRPMEAAKRGRKKRSTENTCIRGPSQIRDQWKQQRGTAKKKEYREHVHQGAKPNKRPMEAAKRGRKKRSTENTCIRGPSQIRDQWKQQRGTAKKRSTENTCIRGPSQIRDQWKQQRGAAKKGVPRTHASGPKDWRWPSPREAVSSNTSDQEDAS